jgi:hypothetical protein
MHITPFSIKLSIWLSYDYLRMFQNMINVINKEMRRSMNRTPTRPSNKNQRQGAQDNPKQKQDRVLGRARTGYFNINHVMFLRQYFEHIFIIFMEQIKGPSASVLF